MSTAYIKHLIDYNGDIVYPQTKVEAIFDTNGNSLGEIIDTVKPTITTVVMSASGWSSNEYSFESTYPVATYDISIELNGDSATDEQVEAWSDAKIIGSATANKAIAKGDVPLIDLPIIIRAVVK